MRASGLNTRHSLVVTATFHEHCYFERVTFISFHLLGSLSPTLDSPDASGWRAKQALSGPETVNLLHTHICWIYKRYINEEKQLKKCLCDSVAFGIPCYVIRESCSSFGTMKDLILLNLSLGVDDFLSFPHSGGTPSRGRGLTSCCGRWLCGESYLVL